MRHRKNPKKHDLPFLIESIRQHGFKATPMIDEVTNTMVAGHGRMKALEQMKFDSLEPPDGVDLGDRGEWIVPVQVATFKDERSRDAYLLADNRITERGGYDNDALTDLLSELAQSDEGLLGTGFDDGDLTDLMDELGGSDDADGDDTADSGREVDVENHTRVIGGHKVRPPVQMTNEDWTLHLGDCLEGLRKMADNSVDAMVTDPPSGTGFMQATWDSDKGGRDKWIDWLRAVMVECMRVLKPGGHGLVWALPRTSHWTAMALELAGFEIRDAVSWIYLSGFPKSLNISKAIDAKLGAPRAVVDDQSGGASNRRGDGTVYGLGMTGNLTSDDPNTAAAAAAAAAGYGTALKPAQEVFWLVRKPLDGTIADTFMKWGTGGINIDAARIGFEGGGTNCTNRDENGKCLGHDNAGRSTSGETFHAEEFDGEQGRWPSNLIVSDGVIINEVELPALYFYAPKPSTAERDGGLEALPPKSGGEATNREDGSKGLENPRAGAGRGGGRRNFHPTVKPLSLCRYLVRLIAPRGSTVIDAFAGSGTTGLAALVEGCKFIGFEMSPEFHVIASERLRSIIEDPRQAEELEAEEAEDASESAAPATDDASTEPDQDGFVYRTNEGELRELRPAGEVFAPGSMVESSTGGMVYVSDPNDKSTEH